MKWMRKSSTHQQLPGSRRDSSWGRCWFGTCTILCRPRGPLVFANTTSGGHSASHRCGGFWWLRGCGWWEWSACRREATPPATMRSTGHIRNTTLDQNQRSDDWTQTNGNEICMRTIKQIKYAIRADLYGNVNKLCLFVGILVIAHWCCDIYNQWKDFGNGKRDICLNSDLYLSPVYNISNYILRVEDIQLIWCL